MGQVVVEVELENKIVILTFNHRHFKIAFGIISSKFVNEKEHIRCDFTEFQFPAITQISVGNHIKFCFSLSHFVVFLLKLLQTKRYLINYFFVVFYYETLQTNNPKQT